MNPLVLYVDDDIANLVVFESSLEGRFPLRTASSGDEALAIMEQEEVGVLLTDQRMPGMTGVDLMEVASERFPDTVRMLITAYSDLHAAIEAINRGQVHYYLRKPWDTRELRLALETAMDRYGTTSRLRQLESRLISTERLYALGVIAAEIAHEIRNPLTTIQSNVRHGVEALRALGDARLAHVIDALEDSQAAAISIEEITRSVELTTRASAEEEIDLREVVQLAVRSIRGELRGKGEVRVETHPDLPMIKGSRNKLGQVVLNLVLNALEATRTSTCPLLGKVTVRIRTNAAQVELEVEDNGAGIEPGVLIHIFDPFFTTKSSGGTGLGLVISRRIVEEHGGRIEVFSKPGAGSRFLVSLPAEPN